MRPGPALAVLLAAAPAAASGPALFDAAGCRACHAVSGRGGNAGPDLTFVGFRRSRAWLDAWLKDPRAVKADTLMPRPGLSEGDRRGLVDYLSGLDGARAARPAPADPARRGELLYRKLGCVACHGPAGRGGHPNAGAKGGVIPALTGVRETFSEAELVEKIRRGSRPQGEGGSEPASAMPAWGERLGADELSALAGYLLSLGPGTARGEEW